MNSMVIDLSASLCSDRARGDAQADSDYDVAVFLRDMSDRMAEVNRLADVATDILCNGGGFVHAMAHPAPLPTMRPAMVRVYLPKARETRSKPRSALSRVQRP